MLRLAVAALVVALLPRLGHAQPRSPAADAASLEEVLHEEMSKDKIPGAAVVVVKDGAVVYARGFGRVSIEGNEQVTTTTAFRLGSTTKMLTATAVLSLVADGRLSLTRAVRQISPELSLDEPFAAVTLRQLLSHSAGLCESAPKIDSRDDDALKREIDGWSGQPRFYTEPGAMYSYAGPSYYLSGRILEIVTGKAYADAMAQLLFTPLGMNSSTLRPLIAITRPLAQGHIAGKDGLQVVRPMAENVAMYPGGSVFSTAEDLGRFLIAMLAGSPLGKAQIASEFFQRRVELPAPQEDRGKYFYGFGTVAYDLGGVPVFEHGGVRRGYGSFIRFIPGKRVGIAVLANLNGANLRKTVAEATRIFAGLTETQDTPRKPLPPSAQELAALAGEYRHCGFTFRYSVKDGKLVREFNDEKTELIRRAPWYYASEDGQDALFLLDKSGRVEYVHSDLMTAKKYSPATPLQRPAGAR